MRIIIIIIIIIIRRRRRRFINMLALHKKLKISNGLTSQ